MITITKAELEQEVERLKAENEMLKGKLGRKRKHSCYTFADIEEMQKAGKTNVDIVNETGIAYNTFYRRLNEYKAGKHKATDYL